MTSQQEDKDFISSYYEHDSGIVDYILFTEDKEYRNNKLGDSLAKKRIQELIFDKASDGKQYKIENSRLDEFYVDDLWAYVEQLPDKYDLSKVSRLPDYPLKIGNITVREKNTDLSRRLNKAIDYFIISDNISISLSHYNKTDAES